MSWEMPTLKDLREILMANLIVRNRPDAWYNEYVGQTRVGSGGRMVRVSLPWSRIVHASDTQFYMLQFWCRVRKEGDPRNDQTMPD